MIALLSFVARRKEVLFFVLELMSAGTFKISFYCLSLLFSSCSSHSTEHEDEAETSTSIQKIQREVFETGKVIPKVTCKSNPAFSFALYLPTDYDTTRKFP